MPCVSSTAYRHVSHNEIVSVRQNGIQQNFRAGVIGMVFDGCLSKGCLSDCCGIIGIPFIQAHTEARTGSIPCGTGDRHSLERKESKKTLCQSGILRIRKWIGSPGALIFSILPDPGDSQFSVGFTVEVGFAAGIFALIPQPAADLKGVNRVRVGVGWFGGFPEVFSRR